jgi:hypothetical protein
VIIYDLNVGGACCGPSKADAKLVVDANAVLSGSGAMKLFQSVSWRDAQVLQASGKLKLSQLSDSNSFNVHESRNAPSRREGLRIG